MEHYNLPVLIVVIVSIYLLFRLVFQNLQNYKIGKFLDVLDISAYTFVGVFLILLNQYFWKCTPFNPFLVDIPVIEGKYQGFVQIEHLDSSGSERVPVKVEIDQTATSCNLWLTSPGGSTAKSVITGFRRDGDKWRLYNVYFNENKRKPTNRNQYYGANYVDVDVDENGRMILEGIFFNDANRKSYGSISVTRISK